MTSSPASYSLRGGAAFNIGIRKNDQFRNGHQPRLGVPKDPRFDLLAQLREGFRLLGTAGPHPGCIKAASGRATDYTIRCCVCPPAFPRRIKKGQEFDHSRPASSEEVSAMIIRSMEHVSFDTTYFSGISPLSRPRRVACPRLLRQEYPSTSSGCTAATRRT
jgi:hypothetical protein